MTQIPLILLPYINSKPSIVNMRHKPFLIISRLKVFLAMFLPTISVSYTQMKNNNYPKEVMSGTHFPSLSTKAGKTYPCQLDSESCLQAKWESNALPRGNYSQITLPAQSDDLALNQHSVLTQMGCLIYKMYCKSMQSVWWNCFCMMYLCNM